MISGEKALIYLEDIDRHSLQQRQRRITGGKIVYRDLEAPVTKLTERPDRVVLVRNEYAFGEFKLDQSGIDPITAYYVRNMRNKIILQHMYS